MKKNLFKILSIALLGTILLSPFAVSAQALPTEEETSLEENVNNTPGASLPTDIFDENQTTVKTTEQIKQEKTNSDSWYFGLTDIFNLLNPVTYVPKLLKVLGLTILQILAWFVGLSGLVLDYVLKVTLLDLKGTLASLTIKSGNTTVNVIDVVWSVVRDFINMFFIFMLLYAAVNTILGTNKVDLKSTITNLIIAAIFINFSLLIPKIILDISTVVTVGLYEQIPGGQVGGMSTMIMNSLGLQTFFTTDLAKAGDLVKDIGSTKWSDVFPFLITMIGGSIFMLVTMFTFFAAAVLFMLRLVDIIQILIMSPLAFAGRVLPQLEKYSQKWWHDLYNVSLFPPIFMLFVWIAFSVLQSTGYRTAVVGTAKFTDIFGTSNLANAGTTGPSSIGLILNFVIVIAFMLQALVKSKDYGARGAETLQGWGKNLKGVALRNTAGRAASLARNSDFAKKVEANLPAGGRVLGATISKISGGYDKDFEKALKGREKEVEESYKRVGQTGTFVKGLTESDETFKARKDAAEKAAKERQATLLESERTGIISKVGQIASKTEPGKMMLGGLTEFMTTGDIVAAAKVESIRKKSTDEGKNTEKTTKQQVTLLKAVDSSLGAIEKKNDITGAVAGLDNEKVAKLKVAAQRLRELEKENADMDAAEAAAKKSGLKLETAKRREIKLEDDEVSLINGMLESLEEAERKHIAVLEEERDAIRSETPGDRVKRAGLRVEIAQIRDSQKKRNDSQIELRRIEDKNERKKENESKGDKGDDKGEDKKPEKEDKGKK